jgi:hypothetical protein
VKSRVESRDFYRAAADVAFSRPERAIPELRRFLASPEAAADDRRRQRAYELLADAYVRTWRYGDAAEVNATLAGEATTDSTGRENAANVIRQFESMTLDFRRMQIRFN